MRGANVHTRSEGEVGAGAAPTGFSLVELLVVLALMLIMYVMLLSPGSRSYQRRQQAACRRNLQFLHMTLQMYAADYRGAYPATPRAETSEAPLSLLVPRYTTRTDIFICPGSGDRTLPQGESFARRQISYAYVMGLTNDSPAEQWLMSDAQAHLRPKEPGDLLFATDTRQAGNNHRQFGGNLLFCDGRAEFSPALANTPVGVPPHTVALNPRR
jgi:prepilin-type N-terminal cleavage/methylation domain-containing protein